MQFSAANRQQLAINNDQLTIIRYVVLGQENRKYFFIHSSRRMASRLKIYIGNC
jgi:hypothetical protein